jgi:hypothetical protein
MRLVVAALILAPIAWVRFFKHLPSAVGTDTSNESCQATLSATVWAVAAFYSTLILIANWGDL